MKLLLRVVLVGVLARVAVVAFHAAPGGLKPLEPSVIAANLNAGRGLTFTQYGTPYRAWKEPLYMVLLAWLTRWAGQAQLAVLLFQGALGIGTAVGVAWIARQLFGDPVKAALAGMIAAVNPFLVYYDTRFIHPLSLDALLFILTTGTLLLAMGGTSGMGRTVRAGLMMGLALWQRAVLLASGALSWGTACLLASRQDRRAMIRKATVWLGLALLIMSPWLIRNYRLFGRVIVTTDFAHILWLGNNPWSNGTYSDMTGRRVLSLAEPSFQGRIVGASELDQHDIFLADACQFIREHPRQFGVLVLRRLWAFVWFSPNAGIEYTAWEGRLYRTAYGGLLALGLMGLALYWRRVTREGRVKAAVLLAAVAGGACVHAVTAMNMKHRVPLELVLAIFASESLSLGLMTVRATAGGGHQPTPPGDEPS